MNSAGLTHGAASDAADYLNSTSSPTQDELLSALVNALNRIARLEARIEVLERVQGEAR
jgi:hypothetical protein